ncbi:MAG: DUF1893 domain-containing protein [Lachnospiraceae bacterium]
MTLDYRKAMSEFATNEYSFVAIRGEQQYTATGVGVKPIMEQMRKNRKIFQGYAVADKIIGKAAALLLVLSGVKFVYGEVMSQAAKTVLCQNQVVYECGQTVDYIENRTHTGMCPLEISVQETENPEEAFNLIEETIEFLMKQ